MRWLREPAEPPAEIGQLVLSRLPGRDRNDTGKLERFAMAFPGSGAGWEDSECVALLRVNQGPHFITHFITHVITHGTRCTDCGHKHRG